MDGLLAGAQRALADYQVEEPAIVRVPGSFELPVVAGALAERGYEAVVALGVVIRGGTPHFEYVCSAATDGLSQIAVNTGAADRLRAADLRHRGAGPRPGRARGLRARTRATRPRRAALITALTLRRIRRGYEPDGS